MTDEMQPCPDCGATFQSTDNYCRQCGMYLAALRAVAPSQHQSRALEPVRAGLPAPVKKAVTALAVGTALQVGVSLAGRYLASQAARKATEAVVPRPKRGKNRNPREVSPTEAEDPAPGAAALSETVMIRRVWIRRQ